MKYRIVYAAYALDLEERVEQLLAEGYELAGSLVVESSVHGSSYLQPMIKKS